LDWNSAEGFAGHLQRNELPFPPRFLLIHSVIINNVDFVTPFVLPLRYTYKGSLARTGIAQEEMDQR
jgi:hypothetical protein